MRVYTTDGRVHHLTGEGFEWQAHDDGDLTISDRTGDGGNVACFARGMWIGVINDPEDPSAT